MTATSVVVPADEVRRRTIRRTDWVPCEAAFIDCRTPGSDLKDNYSFIGAGVSQNPDQYVNLEERHGFNLGAAGIIVCRHRLFQPGDPQWLDPAHEGAGGRRRPGVVGVDRQPDAGADGGADGPHPLDVFFQ